jgi:glucokinase
MEVGHLRPGHSPRQVSLPGASVESIASGFGIEDRARRAIAEWEEATVLVESRFGSAPQDAEHTASESVASGRRFPERFATLMKLANGDRARITTRLIAQAAARGDRLSNELLSDATDVLGWALAQAITLINPARIVIGGGVSLIGQELFFEPVRRACQAEVFRPFAGIAQIVPAALGEEVVVHGALALARAAFHREPPLKAFSPEGESA